MPYMMFGKIHFNIGIMLLYVIIRYFFSTFLPFFLVYNTPVNNNRALMYSNRSYEFFYLTTVVTDNKEFNLVSNLK